MVGSEFKKAAANIGRLEKSFNSCEECPGRCVVILV
jgi:hypothetical protein